jgi:hypothetical protein
MADLTNSRSMLAPTYTAQSRRGQQLAGGGLAKSPKAGLLDSLMANWQKQGGWQGLLNAAGQDVGMISAKVGKGIDDLGATMRLPPGTKPEAYDAVTAATLATLGLGYGPAVGRMAMGAKYEPATMRMFFGEGAKTADKTVLKTAKEMDAKGATRDEIWEATAAAGQPWRKDGDGHWKFEVSDKGAKLSPDLTMGTVGKNLSHDELYSAYPGTARASYIPTTSKDYSPGEASWYGPPTTRYGELVLKPSDTPGVNKVATLHELQHNVQGREGFARGGNTGTAYRYAPDNPKHKAHMENLSKVENARNYYNSPSYKSDLDKSDKWFRSEWEPKLNKLEDSFDRGKITSDEWSTKTDKIFADMKSEKAAKFPNLEYLDNVARDYGLQAPPKKMDSYEAYRRLAGEAEARNVETRMDMTMGERRAKPPWKTLDVPEDELIYRGMLKPGMK